MIRKVTYPPDFKYVSGQELRSRMDQLAYQLQLLDQEFNQAQRLFLKQYGEPKPSPCVVRCC